MAADRRPVVRAPDDAWQRLGELLQLRRAELGYKRRPAFTREHGINIRLVTDIENAYRPNTFLTPTLREIAQAYQVTYDSLIAVLGKTADELTPAPPAALPVPGEPPGWLVSEEARAAADRPYADRIRGRLDLLRLQGVTAPTGGQLFGEGTPDARDWDKYAADWETRDVIWFVADMQRRAAGRDGGNSGTGATGA
jgi:transcriptional regulator with XRE-family HTH domain